MIETGKLDDLDLYAIISKFNKACDHNELYFNGSFYNWLLLNGIELAQFQSEGAFSSKLSTGPKLNRMNIGQLRIAIIMLVEQQVELAKKAEDGKITTNNLKNETIVTKKSIKGLILAKDPKMYRSYIKKYHLNPKEYLWLSDPENIKGYKDTIVLSITSEWLWEGYHEMLSYCAQHGIDVVQV